MKYDKPKVTIDLEEYNELLKLRDTSINVDDLASTVANTVIRGMSNQNGRNTIAEDFDIVCRDKNYKIEYWQKSSTIGYREDLCGIKVTKKKENGV